MRLSAVPLLLAAAALPPAPSVAAPRCEVFVQIEVPGGEDPVNESSVTDSACTASGQLGPAFLIGDGGADYGALHARSEGTFLDGETTNHTTTYTRVEFRDTITLDSPGLAGQIGQIHAAVFLDGFIDVTGSASGSLRVDQLSPSGSSILKLVDCYGGGAVCNGQLPPTFFAESLPIDFNVTFGEPATFAVQLTTIVARNTISTDPGTADVDFGSTATWSGIEEVTVGGNPVPFTVVSESGTDWALPVPEPSPGVLLVVGASVLQLARRPRPLERVSR